MNNRWQRPPPLAAARSHNKPTRERCRRRLGEIIIICKKWSNNFWLRNKNQLKKYCMVFICVGLGFFSEKKNYIWQVFSMQQKKNIWQVLYLFMQCSIKYVQLLLVYCKSIRRRSSKQRWATTKYFHGFETCRRCCADFFFFYLPTARTKEVKPMPNFFFLS